MNEDRETKKREWCDKCHVKDDCEEIDIFLESDKEYYCVYYA